MSNGRYENDAGLEQQVLYYSHFPNVLFILDSASSNLFFSLNEFPKKREKIFIASTKFSNGHQIRLNIDRCIEFDEAFHFHMVLT